jgi:hypothetical protein
LLAVASAIAFGVIHGLGNKIADEAWPYIKSVFTNPVTNASEHQSTRWSDPDRVSTE